MTGRTRLVAGAAGSVLVHGALAAWLLLGAGPARSLAPKDEVVAFEVVETKPPAPPPEVEPPPPPEPKPEPPKPKPKPRVKPKPRPKAPPQAAEPPPTDVPPPSNDAPPPEPSKEPVPLVTGLTMGSTVAAGKGSGMKVGVGNTMYGTPGSKAADPSEVKGYRGSERWVAPYQVTTLPEVRRRVKATYPEEARQQEIEGTVRARLSIDAEGKVVKVKILEGLGHGLDQAAVRALKQYRFKPATVNGEAVGTDLDFAYTFLLD